MKMRCSEAVELLLEADVAELDGTGDSALAAHVRRCDPCRARAAQILSVTGDLSDALDDLATRIAPTLDPADVRVRPRVHWRVLVPLAAAGIGALMLLPKGPDSFAPVPFAEPPAWASGEAGRVARGVMVQSDLHEKIAVLPTQNPDITVVWFMD
jgi:hypothetical protein